MTRRSRMVVTVTARAGSDSSSTVRASASTAACPPVQLVVTATHCAPLWCLTLNITYSGFPSGVSHDIQIFSDGKLLGSGGATNSSPAQSSFVTLTDPHVYYVKVDDVESNHVTA